MKSLVLDELSQLTLKGIKVVDFSMASSFYKFVIAIENSLVEFVVKEDDQFQVLSVVHNGNKYEDSAYLSQFNGFVTDVIAVVKPIVVKKVKVPIKPHTIEYREEQARLKEEQLEKRALEIGAREQLLDFQLQAIEMENQMLEYEKAQHEAQRVRTWTSEHIFLFKWLGVAVVALLMVWIIVLVLR